MTSKQIFKGLANYVQLFNGYSKPGLNWQEMYSLFDEFEFTPCNDFGQYSNFGQAYEHKNLSMFVSLKADSTKHCYLSYREYTDVHENSACIISD